MMHRQAPCMTARQLPMTMPRRVAAKVISTGEHATANSASKQAITQLDSLKQVRAPRHYESVSATEGEMQELMHILISVASSPDELTEFLDVSGRSTARSSRTQVWNHCHPPLLPQPSMQRGPCPLRTFVSLSASPVTRWSSNSQLCTPEGARHVPLPQRFD